MRGFDVNFAYRLITDTRVYFKCLCKKFASAEGGRYTGIVCLEQCFIYRRRDCV
jgi:hypothetical protein